MSSRLYRFGEFEADEARFELRRADERVAVQPKALDFLFCLLRNRARVVTKDELVDHIWSDVAVSDASLSKTARLARQALGDDGRAQVCIETVRGRGFRFVAAVDESAASSPQASDRALARGNDPGAGPDSARAGTSPPAGFREILRERLDRLSNECRRVLVAGAAIGREFDLATVARVTGLEPSRALALLDEAHRCDVVRSVGGKQRLSDDLAREILLDGIGAADRAALHRRIGEVLEATFGLDDEFHLAEIAFHSCEGAASGGTVKAIARARRAGDRAVERLAYDEAADHYRRALEVESLAPADRRRTCDLLLALGEAQLASGRPREGRETLRRAAGIARQLGLGERFAHAVLASGGLLFSTEAGVDDPELVGLLEEALERLPRIDSALRVSIQARLAIALAWSTSPSHALADLIAEAVETARRVGAPLALGHALYARRWKLVRLDLEPGDLEARLALSEEILRLGRRARDRGLELAGRSCRFLDLVESGRIAEADRELAAHGRLAAAIQIPRYRWRTSVYRTMRTLLDGRLADAEVLARATFEEEQGFSPSDLGAVFGAQMTAVRREQGRSAELEPTFAALVERFPAVVAWRAALALLRAEAGREADARDGFETLAADDFHCVRHDPMKIATLVFLAETCALLGDARRAATLYDILRPYAPRLVLVGAGVVCYGAVDRYLGLLAAARGDRDAAACHFAEGLRQDTRAGARPWMAWGEYELARVLARSSHPQERRRSREHLRRARQSADALGMVRLANRLSHLTRALERDAGGRRPRLVGL